MWKAVEVLQKTSKNLSQCFRFPGRYVNKGPREYETVSCLVVINKYSIAYSEHIVKYIPIARQLLGKQVRDIRETNNRVDILC
jgi:hypothetical protein